MTTFLERLNWRYAAKSFDPARPVSESDVEKILEAVRLAPTSFGLQPFHVDVVTDPALKDALCKAGWNQKQFSSASHILAFSSLTSVDQRISDFLHLTADGDAAKRDGLKGYEGMMRGFFKGQGPAEIKVWADRQAYIALGFAMAACAELGIDSCPMEGFSPAEADKILGLGADRKTCVMLTLGYREPQAALRAKVRFPATDLFSRR